MSQLSHNNNNDAYFKDFFITTVKLSSGKVIPVHVRTGIFDLDSENGKETGRMPPNGEK